MACAAHQADANANWVSAEGVVTARQVRLSSGGGMHAALKECVDVTAVFFGDGEG